MSEKANFLPYEEYRELESEIKDVAEVARAADSANRGNSFSAKHNSWVDDTRLLGDVLGESRIKHREGRFGGKYKDGRIDTNIRTSERTIHTYSDHRLGGSATEMRVRRNGQEKVLESDNPLVFKMLTRIALKDIEKNAQSDLDKTEQRLAA